MLDSVPLVPIERWHQSHRSHSPFTAALLHDVTSLGGGGGGGIDLETPLSGMHSVIRATEFSLSPVAYSICVLASKNYLKNEK